MINRFTHLMCAFFLSLQVLAQDSQGFISVTNINPLAVSRDTGEKPQSKVWYYACTQWAVLPDADGTHLWRLDENKWTKVLTLSKDVYKADCKVIGNVVHVLLHHGNETSYLVSVEHVPATNVYRPWRKRPDPVGINFNNGSVTATLDIDSKGRMWFASNAGTAMNVYWSDTPYSKWSDPITIASGVAVDDICGIIAMPGKIGVLWSDQNAQRFGFKTHEDGADPNNWSADEVPASQSAQDIKLGMAKPYLNMKVGKDGSLYCAVRTGYNTKELPRVSLIKRNPSGQWDDLYLVSSSGSRPIVILNDETETLKVIYTTSVENGNDIVYKESPASKISFGPELLLIKGPYNDATSSKNSYTSNVLVLASNSTQVVGALASDGIPPEVCPAYIEWLVYPNPFNDLTNIIFTLPDDADYVLDLYDSRGAKIYEVSSGTATADKAIIVELRRLFLARGLYILRLKTDQEIRTHKIVLEE